MWQLHLTLTVEWDKQCDSINTLIEETLKDDHNKKYQTLHTKLDGSTKFCLIIFSRFSAIFHPWEISKTNIILTAEHMSPLSYGIWYSLHHKSKKWIKSLALEAETGINHLTIQEQDFIRCHCGQNSSLDLIKTIINSCYDSDEMLLCNCSFASNFM